MADTGTSPGSEFVHTAQNMSEFVLFLECPRTRESWMQGKTPQLVEALENALSRWQELGRPDLGALPEDQLAVLVSYSYWRMLQANK